MATEVVAEVPYVLQVFSDGTVKRFTPNLELFRIEPDGPSLAFRSKDVVIDAAKPITARIYLPSSKEEGDKLPLLVYFHGGGFCIGTTVWHGYHAFLGGLSARSHSVVFSVDYRLAPEHRLPAAYDDCRAALQWLTEPGVEPWLDAADFSRVFLAGESAGGNIVHRTALRLMKEPVNGLGVLGLMIIHPFFGGQTRIIQEEAERVKGEVQVLDTMWRLSLPEGADRDHHFCNFERETGVSDEDWRLFPRVTVFLAGKDLLKARGDLYVEFLKGKGAREVAVVVAEEEEHAHHVFFPESGATRLLQSQMAEFVNGQDQPPATGGVTAISKC